MRDGWDIENSSAEKVQSVLSTSHDVSQMSNSEGHLHDLSKFDLDFKSSRQFPERSDIEQFDSIVQRDNKTVSLLYCDVKPQRVLDRDEQVFISSYGFIRNISVKEESYSTDVGVENATIAEEDDEEPLKMNRDMEKETMSGNVSKDNHNIGNNSARQTGFNRNNIRDFSNSSLEGDTSGNDVVMSLREKTMKTLRPTVACHEHHAPIETNSAEIVNHKPQPKVAQEKDNSKRRISFRALVRMKGLGRRMRKKHHSAKKREKYSNHRNDSGSQMKEFKSDSSAKYLLDSSTSASDEQTFSTQMKIAQRKDEEAAICQRPKTLQRSKSLGYHKDLDYQHSDELSCSSGEMVCSQEYLERRRGAMCEELEKTLLCGQQSLADLRAILVVQQKLTGFGLL